MAEALIVYGAVCAWWDSIDKTTNSKPDRTGIPLCPHCRRPLYQMSEPDWWSGVDLHAQQEPGYRAMIEWSRGRCFPNYEALRKAYAERADG